MVYLSVVQFVSILFFSAQANIIPQECKQQYRAKIAEIRYIYTFYTVYRSCGISSLHGWSSCTEERLGAKTKITYKFVTRIRNVPCAGDAQKNGFMTTNYTTSMTEENIITETPTTCSSENSTHSLKSSSDSKKTFSQYLYVFIPVLISMVLFIVLAAACFHCLKRNPDVREGQYVISGNVLYTSSEHVYETTKVYRELTMQNRS